MGIFAGISGGSDIFGAVAETVSRLPKQARYQLRYTRLFSCFIRLGVFSQIKRNTTFATPGYRICII